MNFMYLCTGVHEFYDEDENEFNLDDEPIPPDTLVPSGNSLPANLETLIYDVAELKN